MTERNPDGHGDPVNEEAADWEEAGLPAQEDSTEDQTLPGDRPSAMSEFGSAGTEREAGEPLDTALSRDQPDTRGARGSAARVEEERTPQSPDDQEEGMRLVAEDEGVRRDEEDTLIAEDAGEDRGAHTPEEQAVHERHERGRR
ncbi:hypothetical protein FHX37_2224 [Haloactinospora alba]|uniref:DUF5709 domain-containing protein n=1 Tax=Haloactinospora alba TaxID=405555 RepID=A0A543NKE9_9ACTN|nr:DUF5709 domain-containing protein [Haloactinospora alba]TQN32274.1 hypothetical protein FHX37_2224 [Haloactinospora alba]